MKSYCFNKSHGRGRKGVATWLMVVASVLLGILLFTVSATILIKNIEMSERQVTIAQVSDLYGKLKRVCYTGGTGEIYHYDISIHDDVRAVYMARSGYEMPPDKVSVMISNGNSSSGGHFCFQFFHETLPRCFEELPCNISFTYIGSPSLKNDIMSLIARITEGPPVYRFGIRMEKVSSDRIVAEGGPLID